MKNTYLIISATALLLTAGCSEDQLQERSDAGRVAIGVSTALGDGTTRAATDLQVSQFAAGETFNVFFPDAKATVEHALFSVVDANGTTVLTEAEGNEQPYYVDKGTTVTLHAYYPQTVSETATQFSVEADQTSDEAYKRSDLMYAATADYARGTDVSVTVPLLFAHKLAKLTVIVKVDENISPITNVSIISGSRTIDITDGTTCTLGTTLSDAVSAEAPLTLYNNETGAASLSCAAVMPPQEIAGDFIKVTTATDGSTVYSTTKTLLSGHNYTIVLNVSKAVLAHTFNGIRNWSEPTETFEDPGAVLHF